MSEVKLVSDLRRRTEATEACARKIAQSEGKEWASMWLLTQKSYRDEVETVCQNCYVGGKAPQTQKDAFHNLLKGQCVTKWEKTTGAIGWWRNNEVSPAPTWTDLNTTNSHCLITICKSAA